MRIASKNGSENGERGTTAFAVFFPGSLRMPSSLKGVWHAEAHGIDIQFFASLPVFQVLSIIICARSQKMIRVPQSQFFMVVWVGGISRRERG